MWDNIVKNVKLDQAEYVGTGPLSDDSELKDAAQGVREGTITLVGWPVGRLAGRLFG